MRNCIQLNTIVAMALMFFMVETLLAGDLKFQDKQDKPDFQVFMGDWVRPDGDYTIRVSNIYSDGRVDAGYFNPRPIHVAEASVSVQKGLLKLFIKLQDKGYPGSTYTLYYYAEKDALAGFYYQAAMQQTFEVMFFRKSSR